MANHILLRPKKGWKRSSLPAPLDTWPTTMTEPDAVSKLTTDRTYSKLHAYAAKAIMAYTLGETQNKFSLIKISNNTFAVEEQRDDGTVLIAVLMENGRVRASIVQPLTNRHEAIPQIGQETDEFDATAFYLLLLPILSQMDNDSADDLNTIHVAYAATGEWPRSPVYRLCDALYSGIQTNRLKFIAPGGSLDVLTAQEIRRFGISNGNILFGRPTILAESSKKQGRLTSLVFKDAAAEFSQWASTRKWTSDEEALIPTFPDDYPVLPEAVKIARRYINTHGDRRPMTNFMWRGITSYGKSTGVEMIAAFLHTPLLRMTCHTTMETQQFLSDFVPDNNPVIETDKLPTFEEMSLDPESAYLSMTGISDENATSEMCLEAYGKIIAKNASRGGARFKHIESAFVQALRNGYIVEIQEISRIKDSGVLVGLNEYDRPGSMIPLVDGSFAKRHPDAMVIYTDNVGYASCRPVDPSVLRRTAFVIDSYKMTKEAMIGRVVYNTGFSDQQLLDKMYTVWEKISEFCKDREINEGSISVTELEMWAQAVQADGMDNVYENCIECVVSKATSDPNEQEEIIASVLAIHLGTQAE